MKYRIYYKNRVGFGMYDDIEAHSIEEAIKIFYQENRGCTIELVKKLG